jgi:hypothetical protein
MYEELLHIIYKYTKHGKAEHSFVHSLQKLLLSPCNQI